MLRVAGLLLCMRSAFILNDPTEESLGHVPTPLLMRRSLRITCLLPLMAGAGAVMVSFAGEVPRRAGGPIPVGDLTLEVATLLVIAMSAACLGTRFTSDGLGGIVAAPIVLALVAASMLLPSDYRLIVGSPTDPRWAEAHDIWRFVLGVAFLAFLYLNRSPGSYKAMSRLRPPGSGLRAIRAMGGK